MIATEPGLFFDVHVRALGLGHAPGRYPPEVMAAYRRLLNDTSYIQAVCEDYRAGATVDRSDDDEDRAKGRAIVSPVLLLWSARGRSPRSTATCSRFGGPGRPTFVAGTSTLDTLTDPGGPFVVAADVAVVVPGASTAPRCTCRGLRARVSC